MSTHEIPFNSYQSPPANSRNQMAQGFETARVGAGFTIVPTLNDDQKMRQTF